MTVTATTSTTLQPDQAVFEVIVNSDVNSTLSTILNAVQPVGLTIANFSGVASVSTSTTAPVGPTALQWVFALPVPIASTASTVAALASLASSVPQANGNLSITFSIIGTQVSPQLQQSQTCDIPGLINQARTQAQTLASAANRSVGGVLSISGTTTGPSSTYTVNTFITLTSGSQNCSLTVTFSLLGV
ncbi:MAG TPA: hypothetical protein VMB85_19315 [Bryobacteraceae bacterium]|nr:hypothetical protein [Bryobacteraceae bacterium]